MKKYIRIILLLISIATLFSGAMQTVAPAFVLGFVGGAINPSSCQLFATIGMFMFLFGGMMIHTLYSSENNKVTILWSGLQKFGAAIAVSVAIWKGIFLPVAFLVAGFDFVSGILFFVYLKSLQK